MVKIGMSEEVGCGEVEKERIGDARGSRSLGMNALKRGMLRMLSGRD